MPRIARDAVDFGFGNGIRAPFGRGGFAEHAQPRIEIGLGQIAVLLGNVMLHHARTRPCRRAFPIRQQVFEQKRHARQRRIGIFRRPLPRRRAFAQIVRQQIELGIDFVQAV